MGIDAPALNFNAMHKLAEHGRANLRSSINPQFRAICAKVDKESPELLFGADLTQRLKDLKETSRVGAAFSQRPSTSKSGHCFRETGQSPALDWPPKPEAETEPTVHKNSDETMEQETDYHQLWEESSELTTENYDAVSNIWPGFLAKVTSKAWETARNFKAGQLKRSLSFWRSLTSDRTILSDISDTHLEFKNGTNPHYRDCKPYRFEAQQSALIDEKLCQMLRKGVIEVVTWEPQQVISPIFTRTKKDGTLRVISDLSDLNEKIVYRHFKMDTIETAVNLITENCFMASIDWKDAYYTVPIAASDRKYLKFRWRNNIYQFTALPNGLASAPRIFTKITKVIFSELRKMVFY